MFSHFYFDMSTKVDKGEEIGTCKV